MGRPSIILKIDDLANIIAGSVMRVLYYTFTTCTCIGACRHLVVTVSDSVIRTPPPHPIHRQSFYLWTGIKTYQSNSSMK